MAKATEQGNLKELKMELVKARAGAGKGGAKKISNIKKMIARLHTLNKPNKNEEKSSGELKNKNK